MEHFSTFYFEPIERQALNLRKIIACGLILSTIILALSNIQRLNNYRNAQADLRIVALMLNKIDTTRLDSKTRHLQTDALLRMLTFLRSKPGSEFALSQLEKGDIKAASDFLKLFPDDMNLYLGLLESFSASYKGVDWYQNAVYFGAKNAFVWNQSGILYSQSMNFLEAEASFKKVLAIGKDRNDQSLIALGYEDLAHLYRVKGDLDQATLYYEKALPVEESLGDKHGIASIYANLASISRLRNEFALAIKFYGQAMQIEVELGDKIGIANQLGNLGNIYMLMGEADLALKMHRKAMDIDRQLNRKEGLADDLNSLGSVYLRGGHHAMAKTMYLDALSIDLSLNRSVGLADDYGNLGIVYQSLGELDDAEQAFKKSLWLNFDLNDKYNIAVQFGNLGLLYALYEGNSEKAEIMYRNSLALFEALGNQELILKTRHLIDELKVEMRENNV